MTGFEHKTLFLGFLSRFSDKDKNPDEMINELTSQGWEPYAAAADGNSYCYLFLRRQL